MPSLAFLRRFTRRLGPYASLALVALPLAIVEPMKLVAAVVFGAGHWMTGALVMIFAYALSVLLVEQLFKLVKPNLLKLAWFAAAWTWFVEVRRKLLCWLRGLWTGVRESAKPAAKRPRRRGSAPAAARNRAGALSRPERAEHEACADRQKKRRIRAFFQ